MKKFLFLFIIVLFGVLFSFQFSFAQETGQQLEGFNLVGYGEGGDKSWDVKGTTATIEDKEINITNVDANAYGQEDMNVTAKTGRIDKDKGDMRLEKDVVVTTQTGTKMLTDSLDWQKKEDLITTQDDVTILRENMKAVGKGITAHPGMKQAQLNQDVVVEYTPNPDDEMKDMITISCDGPMEVDYAGQTAVFHDNVIALQGDRKLMADEMQLYFDSEKKQIKEMICIGNVLIVQGENTSFSDKAVYQAGEKKIKLYGRPKLLLYMNDKGKKDSNVPFGS
ncbi:MAG: LPS export ABC transporter periplasmic protein LptC [Candidatus Omnitrophota bacterium]